MLELNKISFGERDDWYYKYSQVLISEISEFKQVMGIILENPSLKESFATSKEIIFLYACILGIIRFLEVIK